MSAHTSSQIREIALAILGLVDIEQSSRRESIVRQLRQEIRTRIVSSNIPAEHVLNIVSTCTTFPGGTTELLLALRFHYHGSAGFDRVRDLLGDPKTPTETGIRPPDLPLPQKPSTRARTWLTVLGLLAPAVVFIAAALHNYRPKEPVTPESVASAIATLRVATTLDPAAERAFSVVRRADGGLRIIADDGLKELAQAPSGGTIGPAIQQNALNELEARVGPGEEGDSVLSFLCRLRILNEEADARDRADRPITTFLDENSRVPEFKTRLERLAATERDSAAVAAIRAYLQTIP